MFFNLLRPIVSLILLFTLVWKFFSEIGGKAGVPVEKYKCLLSFKKFHLPNAVFNVL